MIAYELGPQDEIELLGTKRWVLRWPQLFDLRPGARLRVVVDGELKLATVVGSWRGQPMVNVTDYHKAGAL